MSWLKGKMLTIAAGIGGVIVLGLVIALVVTTGQRDAARESLAELTEQANGVLASSRIATGNPKLTWKNAGTQIALLGSAHRELKLATAEQNTAIEALGRETELLRDQARSFEALAREAAASRMPAIAELERIVREPVLDATCEARLRAITDALDLAYEAGL